TKSFTFTVSLSKAASFPISVKYITSNGTATAGTDYTALPLSTLTFAAGQTTKTVTVAVKGDTLVESDETFFVVLGSAVNATISKVKGTGTIVNDDHAAASATSNFDEAYYTNLSSAISALTAKRRGVESLLNEDT